jgi:hypothetical protein
VSTGRVRRNPPRVAAESVAAFAPHGVTTVHEAQGRKGLLASRMRPVWQRAPTFGSGGKGSAAHIAMVAFGLAARTEFEHLPHRGTGPMMNDLIAGTIDLTMTGGPPAQPPVRADPARRSAAAAVRRADRRGTPALGRSHPAGEPPPGMIAPGGSPPLPKVAPRAGAGPAFRRHRGRGRT